MILIKEFRRDAVIPVPMWTYYPELLERPVPRYTSYPTAAEFHDRVGAPELAEALAAVEPETPLSVYVHIPYCQSICWYCGCNTGAANRTHRLATYLEALEAEISQVGRLLGGRGRVRQIAFGGGSPNAIAPVDFVRLVDRLITVLGCDNPEIAVEIDPRVFSGEWARTLALCGVGRVSLGVQSFSPSIQKAIGRIQPFEMIEDCVRILDKEGISSVNFDLMYGLPDQSLADLEETLKLAIGIQPSRIALFGYAHLPHLIPRQRRIDSDKLPDAQARFEMAALGYGLLTAAGYRAIGFDHFALGWDSLAHAAEKGQVRRNFQGFTDDQSPILIGLGASAISQFPDRLVQNEKNAGRYRMLISGGRLAGARGIMRDANDQVRGRIIEQILCQGITDPVSDQVMSSVCAALTPFEALGLVSWRDNRLILSDESRPYARAIAAAFDTYRNADSAKFSNAI